MAGNVPSIAAVADLELQNFKTEQMMNKETKSENLHVSPTDGKPLLCAAFFRKYGFSNPIRYWNRKWNQFSIYYKIEGYDCDILVRPSTQVVPNGWNAYGEGIHLMPPEIQVDVFSDIKMLEDHHTGDFQVFVNSFENHIATFNYECQMLDFMSICGCPLSCT